MYICIAPEKETSQSEYKKLVDKIKYQEEEINRLKNKYNITRDNFYALAKRINKAIEYIKEHYNYENFTYLSDEDTNKLLEILKGEDKE